MNKKRLIILSAIILLIAIIFGISLLVWPSKKSAAPSQSNPPENTGSFPKETSFLKSNTDYFYSASPSPEDLRGSIAESFKQKSYPEDINWISYATQDKKQIPLTDFTAAAGIKIDSRLSKFLDEYDYDVIACKNNSSGLDYGLVINNKLFNNYPTLQPEEEAILRSQEPTMLKDLYKFLFPDVLFTQKDLDQALTFKNGKYRYAEITLPNGTKSTLNYHLLVDSIVFTTSLQCMDRASQAIEAIE